MVNCKRMMAGAFFLAVMVATAGAQMGMRQGPSMSGIFRPVVGSGAQYEVQTTDGRKMQMEYSVVGKESVNGKDAFWFEMVTSGTPMGEMVMKRLTTTDASNTITSRTIMQMPGRPPMEMSSQMGRMGSQGQPTDLRNKAERVGTESITTPAGTFSCEHYRMKDGSGDTWVSDKVYPLGVVKHQGKDSTMVLIKVLTDVKDRITGTPQPFNPMSMMPHGRPE